MITGRDFHPTVSTTVTVPVEIDSQGDELATSFTLNFNPAVFSNPVVVLGTGAPTGSNLGINANEVASGKLGILVDSTATYVTGTQQIIRITFNLAPNTPVGTYPITFNSSPTIQSVSSALVYLAATFEANNVVISNDPLLFEVSGMVFTPSGAAFRNAIVRLTAPDGTSRSVTTSSFGIYRFESVQADRTYTLTVSSKRFRYGPRVLTVTNNLNDIDFAGLE